MFLKKLRTRRADKDHKTKATKESKSIFRQKTGAVPEIQHVLTMTTSEDEEGVPLPSTVWDLSIAKEIHDSAALTFTQQQIMDYELNHMRGLNEKRREFDALKASQARVLAVKDGELAQAQVDFGIVLHEKDNEIATLKEEVVETKEQLSKVSTVLIRVQHELHERKSGCQFIWSR
jgi:hypothetical protein